jgi:hypothetical protein
MTFDGKLSGKVFRHLAEIGLPGDVCVSAQVLTAKGNLRLPIQFFMEQSHDA